MAWQWLPCRGSYRGPKCAILAQFFSLRSLHAPRPGIGLIAASSLQDQCVLSPIAPVLPISRLFWRGVGQVRACQPGKERFEEPGCVPVGIKLAAEDDVAPLGAWKLRTFGYAHLIVPAVLRLPERPVRAGQSDTNRRRPVIVVRPDAPFIGDRNLDHPGECGTPCVLGQAGREFKSRAGVRWPGSVCSQSAGGTVHEEAENRTREGRDLLAELHRTTRARG